MVEGFPDIGRTTLPHWSKLEIVKIRSPKPHRATHLHPNSFPYRPPSFFRQLSTSDPDQALRWISEIGIKLIDADFELTLIAARLKASGNISYADCHAAAVAKHHNAALLTGDHEFEQLKDEISIVWL